MTPLPTTTDRQQEEIIRAILLTNDLYWQVCEIVRPEMFNGNNLHIFAATEELIRSGKKADAISVKNQIIADGAANSFGGPDKVIHAIITDAPDLYPTPNRMGELCADIVDDFTRHKTLHIAENLRQMVFEQKSSADIIGFALDNFAEIQLGIGGANLEHVGSMTAETIRELEEIQRKVAEGLATGLSLGNPALDVMLDIQGGDVVYWGGRPSMGKTARMLKAMAATPGRKLFYSMETSGRKVRFRLLAALAGVDLTRMNKGKLTPSDWDRINNIGIPLMEKLGIYIDDTPAMPIRDYQARARKAVIKEGVESIWIDYGQLMTGDKSNGRTEEVAGISRTIQATGKILDVPTIALLQLNRQNEQRADKKPMMSDLKESGQFEQDADVVLFQHRPEYYDTKPVTIDDREYPNIALSCTIVAKNKDGPVGEVWEIFEKKKQIYHPFDPDIQKALIDAAQGITPMGITPQTQSNGQDTPF